MTLTRYNGQQQQTTPALIAAFTKAAGIKVSVDKVDGHALTHDKRRCARLRSVGPASYHLTSADTTASMSVNGDGSGNRSR